MVCGARSTRCVATFKHHCKHHSEQHIENSMKRRRSKQAKEKKTHSRNIIILYWREWLTTAQGCYAFHINFVFICFECCITCYISVCFCLCFSLTLIVWGMVLTHESHTCYSSLVHELNRYCVGPILCSMCGCSTY